MSDEPALLIEQGSQDPVSGRFLRRIDPDGTYWEYASVSVSIEDGQIVSRPVPARWRAEERITDDDLSTLAALVAEEFPGLSASYGPAAEVSDGFVVTWTACVDDRRQTVVLNSVDASGVPGLAQISDAFEEAVSRAAELAGDQERTSGE
jgi:hypothetical protein